MGNILNLYSENPFLQQLALLSRSVSGSIRVGWGLDIQDGVVWTELIWLRIATSRGLT
jgi:hypothetical protein